MDFAAARRNMVESQIRANRIADPALVKALGEVAREVFLPKQMRRFAYLDDDIEVAPGRYMIEPLVLARLLQEVEIGPSDVVLGIGDATGYATAVMARLAQTVVALECDPDWAQRATAALTEMGVDNAAVVTGPLERGYPAQAPYDVIVFAGAVAEIPASVRSQLAENGRLAAVVDPGRGMGKVTRVVRSGDTFGALVRSDAGTPYLPGLAPIRRFSL